MYLQGKTFEEIASSLGVKAATVRKWKQRDKWPDRAVKPKQYHEKKPEIQKPDAVVPATLSYKQQLFCEIYADIFNATMAYMRAYGACRATARVNGPELLHNTAVRAYVQYLKDIKSQQILADIGDLVDLHMAIAFADYTDYTDFGTEDRPVVDKSGLPVMIKTPNGNAAMLTHKVNFVRLKSPGDVDGRMIAEVKTSKDGTSVKLRNQEYSMRWLSDYFQANPMDRHRVEYDQKRIQLERERFEHQKKQDEKGDW